MSVRSVKKEIKQVRESMAKQESSFAWEIIQEKDRQIKCIMAVIVVVCIMWMCSMAAFLMYMNQYDFTEYVQDGSVNIIGNHNEGVLNGTES